MNGHEVRVFDAKTPFAFDIGLLRPLCAVRHTTNADVSNVCSNVGYLVGMLEEALKQLENHRAPLSTHREAAELKPQKAFILFYSPKHTSSLIISLSRGAETTLAAGWMALTWWSIHIVGQASSVGMFVWPHAEGHVFNFFVFVSIVRIVWSSQGWIQFWGDFSVATKECLVTDVSNLSQERAN